MREIFSLGKLKGINLTRFSPQFSPHFSPHMSGARFTASTICTFFLEILKKISPVRSAELPKVAFALQPLQLRSACCLWAPHPPGTMAITSNANKILLQTGAKPRDTRTRGLGLGAHNNVPRRSSWVRQVEPVPV